MDQLTIIPGATPEQQQAVAMHYEIVEAARQTANSLLELGRKLKRMKDSGLYKTLGYESFGDYTEQAVGIRQRQAYNYISVVESLPARLIEENAAAGVTKLALLSKLGPEDREEVAGDLANITVKQLEQLIAEKKSLEEQLSIFQHEAEHEAEAEPEPAPEVDTEAVREQVRAELQAELQADHDKEIEAMQAAAKSKTEAAAREAKEKLRKAKEDLTKRVAELEEAHRKELDRAKAEAAAAAAKEQQAKAAAQVAAAEKAEEEAKQKAEAMAKQLALANDEDGLRFSLLFEEMQEKANAMLELAGKIKDKGDPDRAEKYLSALGRGLEAIRQTIET